MKKLKSLLILVCLCAFVLSCAGQNVVIAANKADSVTLIDLVRLKKYLAEIPVDSKDFDYNKDGKIDSLDLVVLVNLILNPQENQTQVPDIDDDGYYNDVIKP